MNSENTKKLWETFPLLYAGRKLSLKESLMPFGFEHGDGWFQIIWDLSEKLEPLIQKYVDEHPESKDYPKAVQVKEKYGTLRFYMTGYLEEFNDLISKAEKASCVTCEECGQPGKLRGLGWYTTLCDPHSVDKYGEDVLDTPDDAFDH